MDIRVTQPRPGLKTGLIVALFIGLSLVLPGARPAAGASDLMIIISQDVIQRFLAATAPLRIKYEILPGTKAAEISFFRPRLTLEPGRPGRIWVEFDYKIRSELLGLEDLTGQVKPELKAEYVHQLAALKMTVHDFVMDLGDKFKIKLDRFIRPTYVPLIPNQPLELERHQVWFKTDQAALEVIGSGLKFTADYSFTRQPRP